MFNIPVATNVLGTGLMMSSSPAYVIGSFAAEALGCPCICRTLVGGCLIFGDNSRMFFCFFSYFSIKTHVEALLMSSHNTFFTGKKRRTYVKSYQCSHLTGPLTNNSYQNNCC